MQQRLFVTSILGLVFLARQITAMADSPAEKLTEARDHTQHGRYDEALEILDELAQPPADGVDATELALARCQALHAKGQREAAEEVLTTALKQDARSPDLHAELAQLHYERGRFEAAQTEAAAALESDADHLLARLIQAHIWANQGDVKQADDGYRWFVRYYNRRQPKDARSLVYVCRGASQYARWHSVSQIFDFCVNTLCTDAFKADKQSWQARYMAGQLLLEKYNKAQGQPELKAALAINPRATEVLCALGQAAIKDYDWDEAESRAQTALEISPKLPAALRILAETKLFFREFDAAEKLLNEALEVNPIDQDTLALLATLRLMQDGWPDPERLKKLVSHLDHIGDLKLENPTRFELIMIDVASRNSKPGYFLTTLGEQLDRFRQHSIAEPLFQEAIRLMPQLSEPKTALGQLYMQTGRMNDAKKLLDEAFKADPYHVRVSNMRKVLKVLDDYETITTDHFVIRADSKMDKLLARYMAEYMEEIYPELTELFGFEPEQRTQIELYNTAKGLSAHQWFSARMVGLPWVQTIGASTGVIIAITSPTSMEEPLNWARVMKHEYVHILTLQQTHFNIPHWYTEALAVRSEGIPRPVQWNKLLLERVPKRELKNLDTLSMGFIRAGNQANWNFAYCQSVLYAEYMVERFGEPSLAKLLDAYRRNRTTDQAIPEVFGVDQADFEKGYVEYLDKVVADIRKTDDEPEFRPNQIERTYEKNKKDPQAAADYAHLLLLVKKRDEARELAEEVLKKAPQNPVAAFVMGALLLREDKADDAAQVLEPALDREHPNRRVLELLVRARLKLKESPEALELCELGKQHFPYNSDWWKGIAAATKLNGDTDSRRDALKTLTQIEADDPAPCKALSEMALAEKNYEDAFQYARMALHIDVLDAEIHQLLGASLHGLKRDPRAIQEFETALELKPGDLNLQLDLAEVLIAADRQAEARALIEKVLTKDPAHERALELKSQLKK
ncbi:MAG: tetratricopeptide repeat protein [Planctomycetes bacterium]|nr:tetratricopeptide repeat protein [Planctomycetota bacterium]